MPNATKDAASPLIGQPAPPFSLPDQHGKTHRLSDHAGKTVVLFWYPKDDTPSFAFTQ